MTTTTVSTIRAEIQSLSPTALIEMFELDMTNAGQGIFRFHAGTNQLSGDLIWKGNTYIHLPIEAEGFAVGTTGTLPRPKLRLANIDGAFSATVAAYNDLIGLKITRKRTFMKYLDAANFLDGHSGSPNPDAHYPDEVWFIDQKVSETRYVIEWELASAFDLMGIMLPARQINQNACPWAYRGAECSYHGIKYFNTLDVTTNLAGDACGKRLASCELRFGVDAVLPFGGFPGSVQYG